MRLGYKYLALENTLAYYTTPLIMPQFNFITLEACIIVLNILGNNNFRRGWNKVLNKFESSEYPSRTLHMHYW
jgi:hypothetical protein